MGLFFVVTESLQADTMAQLHPELLNIDIQYKSATQRKHNSIPAAGFILLYTITWNKV